MPSTTCLRCFKVPLLVSLESLCVREGSGSLAQPAAEQGPHLGSACLCLVGTGPSSQKERGLWVISYTLVSGLLCLVPSGAGGGMLGRRKFSSRRWKSSVSLVTSF